MGPLLLSALVLIVLTIASKLYTWAADHLSLREKMKNLPGPKTYPFIGIALQIANVHPDDLFKWFKDVCYQYSEGLVLTWVGTEPVIHIRRPKQMEVILPNNKLIKKSHTYDSIQPWLGSGLLTSSGDIWYRHRRLITPSFHFGFVEGFYDVISEKAEILCQCIKSKLEQNPRDPVNVFNLAIKCTLDTFCETAMGTCENILQKEETPYVLAIKRFAQLATKRTFTPWLRSDFIYGLTQDGKEFNACIKTMHDFTMNVVERKLEERKRSKESGKKEEEVDEFGKRKRKPFMELLMDSSENSETKLTKQEICEEVDTFMFAGHDTTGVGICWCLFALGNNPQIQDKVQEEFKQVFGNDNKPATFKQLGQLKYLDRVMKEALRYYPSVPAVARCLEDDVIFDDKYTVAKGSTLFIHILQMHRDPKVWRDPDVFDPDRFLPENSENRHPYAYVPFSAGPRNCIGQKFALLEYKTVLTSVLRKWRIQSVVKMSDMKLISHFLLKPENDKIELRFTPLSASA